MACQLRPKPGAAPASAKAEKESCVFNPADARAACATVITGVSAMVLLASTYDQSRFFRAEDLTQDKVLRIKSVTEESIGQGPDQQKKLVVWFTNHPKGLVLNRTNNRTIRGAYGD